MTPPRKAPHPSFVGVQLALLSFAAGCMDIISYRTLGQVFTSAMTGNAALLGQELGQFNLPGAARNATAFLSFLAGLAVGAVLLRRSVLTPGWSASVVRALAVEEALLVGFAALWQLGGGPEHGLLYPLMVLSALAMGMQSAVAHRVGVPGITTTYFTGTVTNIIMSAAERGVLDKPPARKRRWPIVAFAAYIAGAASTGFLMGHPSLSREDLLAAVPALAVAVVLAYAALQAWKARRDGA